MQNIIIVEDSKAYRKGLKLLLNRIFKSTSVEIDEAENGLVFLDKINKKQPSLVLMDVKMPIMGGIEATKIAKKKYPDLNIIAITSNDDYQIIHDMKNAGANTFLVKGFDGKTLIDAITKLSINTDDIITNQR